MVRLQSGVGRQGKASLALRLLAAGSVVWLLLLLIAPVTLEEVYRSAAESGLRERLQARIYLLMGDTELDGQGEVRIGRRSSFHALEWRSASGGAAIFDQSWHERWRSPSALSPDWPTLDSPPDLGVGFGRYQLDGQPHYLAVMEVVWEVDGSEYPLRFLVYESTARFDREISLLMDELRWTLAGLAILFLLLQVLLLIWGMRPLRRLEEAMGAVESGERRSLGGDYPRELAGVAEALDQLLDHVERRHQRDQEALSDLAHSIKTPLTLLQGIEPNDPNTRSLIDEQVLRLDAVVRHYLDHASLTPGRPLAPPLALTPLIERVVAALGRIDRRGISVDLQVDMEWQVAGSEGEWFELFGNLLENGFKWANHQVRVVIDAVEDGVVIVVSDDGPGVEEEELAGLAERGCRLDESVPGHGIGLSTVATIVAARQGRIDFGRSVEGGLQVSIWLPATVVRVWGKGQGKDKNLSDLL